jgi:hypothetical protein
MAQIASGLGASSTRLWMLIYNLDLAFPGAELVADNQPNLVLFVGEALVGNDGVDQLVEFNK